jgi:EAL domain-containing protein (putative c-di-GMP-specific phosphodiesterase class I)
VEDRSVLEAVLAQGIDLAQGYYIHRPNISMAEAMKVDLSAELDAWRRS